MWKLLRSDNFQFIEEGSFFIVESNLFLVIFCGYVCIFYMSGKYPIGVIVKCEKTGIPIFPKAC